MLASASKRSRRNRLHIDRQISQLIENCPQPARRTQLQNLITHVQACTDLLNPNCASGHTPCEIPDLVLRAAWHLSAVHRDWTSQPNVWHPTNKSHRIEIGGLAVHLLGGNEVPRFMHSVWWNDEVPKRHRIWFRHLALGNDIRGTDISGIRTKIQARQFLKTADHLSIDSGIASALCGKPPVARLPKQDRFGNGNVSRRRRKLAVAQRANHSSGRMWPRIGVADFFYTDDSNDNPRSWTIRQIRTPKLLHEEGRLMNHCVGSYADACIRGLTSIWSMKAGRFGEYKRVLTIEIDPRRRSITTMLGGSNRHSTPEERRVVKHWAKREQLSFSLRFP